MTSQLCASELLRPHGQSLIALLSLDDFPIEHRRYILVFIKTAFSLTDFLEGYTQWPKPLLFSIVIDVKISMLINYASILQRRFHFKKLLYGIEEAHTRG